jgi:hypothetical protein
MRGRKKSQLHLSLSMAVCICLFLPLSVFAGEYTATPAAEGSGQSSAIAGPWQAGLCEVCYVLGIPGDCDPGLQCAAPASGIGPNRCIPDNVLSYECPVGESDDGGCLIGTAGDGTRLAE